MVAKDVVKLTMFIFFRPILDIQSNYFAPRSSKKKLIISTLGFILTVLWAAPVPANSPAPREEIRALISVMSVTQARIKVEIFSSKDHRTWSFRNVYGPVIGLGGRIENFRVVDSQEQLTPVQKVAPGEFSTPPISRVSYEVDLRQPANPSDMSHVSWLNSRQGLLMLADLLPQVSEDQPPSVTIELKIPKGWIVSANLKSGNGVFRTQVPDEAVFLIGDMLREEKSRVATQDLLVTTSGDWPFPPADVSKWASRLVKEYSGLTGFKLKRESVVFLLPYPGQVGAERWSAETRGNDIVLLLGRNASRAQLLARLAVVLTHEIFHLWVPGSLSLKGDYDWFFEGFTLYLALRMALKVNLIDFREYLATLARVCDSYQSTVDADRLSLIDLSERRWTSSPSLVYEKGMLVAFIYDLELRRASGGKSNFEQIYRTLFNSDFSNQQANEVILHMLDHSSGMEQFSRRYIQTPVTINVAALLAPYGIRVERDNFRTQLNVEKNVSESQLRVLRSLGYEK